MLTLNVVRRLGLPAGLSLATLLVLAPACKKKTVNKEKDKAMKNPCGAKTAHARPDVVPQRSDAPAVFSLFELPSKNLLSENKSSPDERTVKWNDCPKTGKAAKMEKIEAAASGNVATAHPKLFVNVAKDAELPAETILYLFAVKREDEPWPTHVAVGCLVTGDHPPVAVPIPLVDKKLDYTQLRVLGMVSPDHPTVKIKVERQGQAGDTLPLATLSLPKNANGGPYREAALDLKVVP